MSMLPARSGAKLRRSPTVFALLALATLGTASCKSDSESFSGPLTRMEVRVIPIGTETTNLQRGITLQLRAIPVNADENFVDIPVTWTSSDNSRATVDANGLVTTVGGGDVTISATAQGETGTFDLNVQYPVGTVPITGGGVTIRQEGAVQLMAAAIGTDGQPAIGRTITWTSSNPLVATVSQTGFVSGLTNGTVTITATSEGVSGTTNITVQGSPVVATVTVAAPAPFTNLFGVGQVVNFTQTPKAGSGTTITGTTPVWASSTPAVATVTQAGVVTIVGAGSTTISSTVDNGLGVNVSGSVQITAAPQLTKGVAAAVPTVAAGGFALYVYVVPAAATSFSASTTGGAGDADLYVFQPGVVPGTYDGSGNALAWPNSTAFSAASGNAESVSRTSNLTGVWRVYVQAWPGAGAVTGVMVTATHTP